MYSVEFKQLVEEKEEEQRECFKQILTDHFIDKVFNSEAVPKVGEVPEDSLRMLLQQEGYSLDSFIRWLTEEGFTSRVVGGYFILGFTEDK